MALVHCPECKSKISEETDICPKCGLRFESPRSQVMSVILVFLVAAIVIWALVKGPFGWW